MDIKIRKAKINRNGTVEAVFTDPDGNEISMKGRNKCHPDLRDAFGRLVPFLADLTEQKEADIVDWDDIYGDLNKELLKKLDVTGISLGSDDNNRFVTLTGRRTLFTSRILNLNAPGVEMDSDTFEWAHLDEFDIAVKAVVFEVTEYICNRKWEVFQTVLDFEADPDDPFAEAQPAGDAPEFADNIAS